MSDRLEASLRFSVIPEWVLNHPDLSDRSVRLYGVLARYADEKGVAWPSRMTLAGRLWCSRDSVDRSLQQLAGVGAVTKQKRFNDAGDHTSNLYILHPGGNQQTLPIAPVPRGGRDGAATGGRTDAGTGGRVGAAQNDNQVEGESFEREPVLDEAARVPLGALSEEELARLPKKLKAKAVGDDVPEWISNKPNQGDKP